MGISWKSTYSS